MKIVEKTVDIESFSKIRSWFFFLLMPAAVLLVIYILLLVIGFDFEQHRTVLRFMVGSMSFCMGVSITGTSCVTLVENIFRKKAGMRTLGMNRYGRWEGNSFFVNQLINSGYFLAGSGCIGIAILCAVK